MPSPVALAVLAAVAVPVTCSDLRERRIPDVFTLGGLSLLSLLSLAESPARFGYLFFSSVVASLAFLLVRLLTRGNLGLGDVKYSACIGAALGIEAWLTAVSFAACAGLVFGIAGLLSGRLAPEAKIPFAPFLSLGAACAAAAEILSGSVR